MTTAEVFAPAKVNLTLHVTGQRPDGYHLLDSLVAFADVGDRVTARAAAGLSFGTDGPFGTAVPSDGSNLVLRAADLMFQTAPEGSGAALTLHKALPPASGIGGGSSDAAATLTALSRIWQTPEPSLHEQLGLGADVPVCGVRRAVRMRGIGEVLDPVPTLPPLPAVLINPGVEVPTPAVFRTLASRDNPAMPDEIPSFDSARSVAGWLWEQRNDLETPAIEIAPAIAEVIDALQAQKGCLLARMSGSGATCFGLFADNSSAQAAAGRLVDREGWWVAPTTLA